MSRRDHPRSRGVYSLTAASMELATGSSPLARGLQPKQIAGRAPHRIIPARAGFTVPSSRCRRSTRDHPRSRGVYHRRFRVVGYRPWIIPARAGFTRPLLRPVRERKDHPRSRGVYTLAKDLGLPTKGSSPLARGLRPAASPAAPRSRIIPARAGFTLADPWNPNEPTLYQTPAAFTADLGPAPPGRDSAVEFGAALSAAGRAGRDLAAAGLRPRFGHHPDMHRRVATTSG